MSDPLWTAAEAEKATSGTADGNWTATGIGIDSRSVHGGDLFVALIDRRDGHDFIPDARKRRAVAVVSSRADTGRPVLKVPDTSEALTDLAGHARARADCHCTVITGSVGKTSLKEMCARIFSAAGNAHWSQRSFNNHWGVPLSLAAMPRRTSRAVLEIGMNAPGEIAPLTALARPDCAVVTSIAQAHLHGLGDIKAIAREKASIFSGLGQSGVAIIPAKARFSAYLATEASRYCDGVSIYSFGRAGDADARVIDIRQEGQAIVCSAEVLGERVTVRLNALGEHWAINAVAALLIGRLSGVAVRQCAGALEGFAPPLGRGRSHDIALPRGGRACLLDDSYNANPASMRAGLSSLAACAGRRIAVLGVMEELGRDSLKLHGDLAAPLSAAGVSSVFLLGDRLEVLVEPLTREGIDTMIASDSDSIARAVMTGLRDGDTVFVKGSNTSGVSQVASALRDGLASVEPAKVALHV